MKKYLLIILLSAYAARVLSQGSVTPSELLTIAFEDATGARDTVYIGHYMDSCYLYINPPPSCPKIVSPNIDTAFGEVDLGSLVQPGVFTARIENKMSDGYAYDWYTKYDIRYCDMTAVYATFYNFFNDPLDYKIRFYNYTSPIIAKIYIQRYNPFLPDTADFGCFCEYNATYFSNINELYGNGWYRGWMDSSGNGSSKAYDRVIDSQLIDTIDINNIAAYIFQPNFTIVGIQEYNAKNKDYKVYPVPFLNEIIIDFTGNEFFNYTITDINGAIIRNGELIKKKIDTSEIMRGLYSLTLYNESKKLSFKILKI